MVGLPQPPADELAAEVSAAVAERSRGRGREGRFRVRVVAAYDYTCALTGYRLTTIAAGSIVDAAHIHQFADSRNNDVQNGLALSKNAHWLFDIGLGTEYGVASAEYRVPGYGAGGTGSELSGGIFRGREWPGYVPEDVYGSFRVR